MKVTHPFLPIVDLECKVLILGSFPSVISRENAFYYGNAKNRFWPMLSQILETDFVSLANEEKRNKLLAFHIAVYDVITSCTIEGSSDSSIRNVCYADIPGIIENTKISKILCNGKKAYSLLIKKYPELQDICVSLPSTSPANAACSMDKLIIEWSKYI